MRETKVPPEFEWIKPGVKAVYLTQTYNIVSKPFLMKSPILEVDIWWVKLQRAKYAKRFSVPVSAISQEPITLTLTREQAEALIRDTYTFGPSDTIDEIKEMIEEKLK